MIRCLSTAPLLSQYRTSETLSEPRYDSTGPLIRCLGTAQHGTIPPYAMAVPHLCYLSTVHGYLGVGLSIVLPTQPGSPVPDLSTKLVAAHLISVPNW
eukprot:3633941-Rhodomonas_salina.4